mgnify:CR=1 FL=1
MCTNDPRNECKTSISAPLLVRYFSMKSDSVMGSNRSSSLSAHFRVIPFSRSTFLSSVTVRQKVWTPLLKVRLNAPEANLFTLSSSPCLLGVRDSFHIVVCFCLYHKYNTSAANTTIKCWKNSRETINFSLFLT